MGHVFDGTAPNGLVLVPQQQRAHRSWRCLLYTSVVHPRGELHEYINGPQRTLLFRVRYGDDMSTRSKDWPTNEAFQAKPEDVAFFRAHPDGVAG